MKTSVKSIFIIFTGTDIFRWVYGLKHGRVLWQVYGSTSESYVLYSKIQLSNSSFDSYF